MAQKLIALTLCLCLLLGAVLGMETSSTPAYSVTKALPEKGLTLTLSQPPSHEDCVFVARQLHNFNIAKTGKIVDTHISCPSIDEPIGLLSQTSLLMDENQLEKILANEPITGTTKIKNLIIQTQLKSFERGAKRLFCECEKNSHLNQIYIDLGLNFAADYSDFSENVSSKTYFKDINIEELAPFSTDIELTFTQKTEESSEESEIDSYRKSLSDVDKLFGAFVYTPDTQDIKGGVFGYIAMNEGAQSHYCYIYTLWLDESLRGKGVGTLLMAEAESYATGQGAQFIQLDTCGFQAPDFYRSIGYTVIETYPGIWSLQGKTYSDYICTKALSNNSLQDIEKVLSYKGSTVEEEKL